MYSYKKDFKHKDGRRVFRLSVRIATRRFVFRNKISSNPDSLHIGRFYLPVVVGGESQWRSNWFKARVHSVTHAEVSCSTPAALGVRPPHIAGFKARRRACLGMRFLSGGQQTWIFQITRGDTWNIGGLSGTEVRAVLRHRKTY